MAVSDQAIPGHGTSLELSIASVYTAIAFVNAAKPGTFARDDIETTHMLTTDGAKTYMPGLSDAGEVVIDVNYQTDASTHTTLTGLKYSKNLESWKYVYSDGGYESFVGYIKGFDPETPIDGKVNAKVTIKISGKITHTAAV